MCKALRWICMLALIWPICTRQVSAQADLSRCNQTAASDGVIFIPIKSFTFNRPQHDDEYLHIRVYVQTQSDAHIYLTAGAPEPIYEILIAVHSTRTSHIRDANSDGPPLAHKQLDFDLPSQMSHAIAIELVARTNGLLQVFLPDNYRGAFMQHRNDANTNALKQVSFANSSLWHYDCDFDPAGVDASLAYERFVNDLTAKTNGAMMAMPPHLPAVDLRLEIAELDYQSHATLRTRVHFILSWMDKRLRWKPIKYEHKTFATLPASTIWTPTLWLLNSVRSTHCMADVKVNVFWNGTIVLTTKDVNLQTLCGHTRREWPNEYMLCDLVFGLVDHTPNYTFGIVPLRYVHNEHQSLDALNNWRCVAVKALAPSVSDSAGNLRLQLALQRSYMLYTCVYVVPMLAAALLLLLSFRVKGIWRGVLILTAICILWAMDIVYLVYHTHLHYLPKFSDTPSDAHLHFLPTLSLFAYQLLQGIATFCYMLHIAIMWLILYPLRAKPERSFIVTRLLFCLSSSDMHIYENDEEMKWYTVADRLNGICFGVVSGAFVAITIWLIALGAAVK